MSKNIPDERKKYLDIEVDHILQDISDISEEFEVIEEFDYFIAELVKKITPKF